METFSALLAICAGNSPVTVEFPPQRPVTRSFDVSFDLRLNKRLSKQWWGWWFETPSRPLWRQSNKQNILVAGSLGFWFPFCKLNFNVTFWNGWCSLNCATNGKLLGSLLDNVRRFTIILNRGICKCGQFQPRADWMALKWYKECSDPYVFVMSYTDLLRNRYGV